MMQLILLRYNLQHKNCLIKCVHESVKIYSQSAFNLFHCRSVRKYRRESNSAFSLFVYSHTLFWEDIIFKSVQNTGTVSCCYLLSPCQLINLFPELEMPVFLNSSYNRCVKICSDTMRFDYIISYVRKR